VRSIPLLLISVAVCAAQDDLERQATELVRKHCLACHSDSAKMGGLVLERRETALRGGKSGPAIVPGAPARSPLAVRVSEGKMPPGNPLPTADRQVLARWIEAGAPWSATLQAVERKRAGKDFWSLRPLKKTEPKIAENSPDSWKSQPIDRYLLAAMSAKGLTPSGPAGRSTMIRRVTFDLTGLPPAPEEVEAFVKDDSAGAYERLVDRLLASPAYGERWGRHWMDVIRFGESHGYEQNHLRTNAWPFRDYIIRSLNEDKPFDRLILEHLAGDVVGKGDPAVEVGAGFLVAGPHDTVGNQAEAAKRQQRADDLDDMINATGSAFLGLTVNCARCHDHKFDPIQQRDYYRMAAVFNGVIHTDRDLATDEEKRRSAEARAPLDAELKSVNVRLSALRKEAEPAIAAGRDSILAKYRPAADSRLTEERFAVEKIRWVRLRILRNSANSVAAIDEIEVWSGSRNVALALAGTKLVAGSERRADGNAEAYSAALLNDGKFDRRWFAANSGPVDITMELARAEAVDRVSWSRDREGGFQGKFEGPPVSNYQVEVSADGAEWKRVASSEGRLPARAEERDELLLMAVISAEQAGNYRDLEKRRRELQDQLAKLPKLPTAYIGRPEQPKEPVYLLKRGSVMDRGEAIVPASLSTLAFDSFAVNEEEPAGNRRVALARWLTDPRNPLTPRVMANRLWHYHFGRGIVGTPSDFGYNGERPTHPELLDYLALRLQEYGWKLKPLHREILLSMAYRQSSAPDEAKARVDSDARMLWRFPPQRLTAEAIRDSILAVSGKLDRRMGGPGFHLFRYTVDNVATYFPISEFGPDTFRRAVYQTAARSVRSELLGQYDCPDPSLPEPRRIVTTSPLQALALLNNAFVLDQAKFFAERLQREAGGDRARQVERAFVVAFGRAPEGEERASALELIAQHGLAAFCRALLNANELIYVM